MAGQYRFKDINGNIVAQISASSAGAIAFSGSAVDFSNASTITLGQVQLAGTASNALLLDGFDSTAFVFTSSFNTISQSISSQLTTLQTTSGSNIGRLNNLESKSSSVDISISSINSFTASNANQSLNSKTGSYATTGSNTFVGTQIVSASMYVQGDFVVFGSSSIQYISASSVSIGTNIVQLNTNQPAVRFGGLSVQDSGSAAGVTGSMFWDGCCNRWIYSNPSGVGYSGGVLMSGPRGSTLGNEPTLTCNYIAKSGGGDHLYDSCIWEMSGSVGINTNSPLALLHLNTSATACDTLKISNGTQSLSLGVNNGAGGSYIFENCGQDFRIGTNNTERIRVMNTGAVCFTCQIYLTNQLIVQDGANSLFTWSSCGNFQPGMFAQSCIGSSYSGLYAKVYGSQVNAGVFGTNTQCVAIVVTEGACNKGLMVGTMSSAPLYMGTSNVVRATIASSGETTFNNIICAPSIIATNCISINTTNPGNYKLYVCNGTATTKATRIDIGYGAPGVKDFGGLDIFRSNTNGIGDGASITFSGLRADLSDVEYAGYGYVIESCTNSTHAGALSLMTTYAGNARCERVRITGIGNVGIGTCVPSDRLSITDASTYTFNIGAAAGGAGAVLYTLGSAALTFATCGSSNERMRITSTGQVAIGATSNLNNFTIKSSSDTITAGGLSFQSRTCVTNFIAMGLNSCNDFEIQTWTTPSWITRLYIKNNGNIGIGTTVGTAALGIGGSGAQTTANLTDGGSRIGIIESIPIGGEAGNGGALVLGSDTWGNGAGRGQIALKALLINGSGCGTSDLAFSLRNDPSCSNLTERMRITSSGLVTKPYQTYFNVRASANQAVNADAKISYDTIVCSVGGNFNTSTSRFTAPVAGVYLFTLSASVTSGGIHSYHALYIRVNNTSSNDINFRFRGASNSCNTQWFGITGTAQLNLAANDYVEIFGYTDTTIMTLQSSETRWQGYLQG